MHISIENSILYEIPHREKSTEKIQFFLLVEKIKNNRRKDEYNEENRLAQEIQAKEAIAAYDVTVNRQFMARYWWFINNHNDKISEGYIYSDDWIINTSGLAKVIMLMHVVKDIVKVIHLKEKWLIVVGSDYLKFVRRSISAFNKTLQGAAEGVSSIIELKQLMKSVKTEISIEYVKGKTKVKKFEDDPLPFLIN